MAFDKPEVRRTESSVTGNLPLGMVALEDLIAAFQQALERERSTSCSLDATGLSDTQGEERHGVSTTTREQEEEPKALQTDR